MALVHGGEKHLPTKSLRWWPLGLRDSRIGRRKGKKYRGGGDGTDVGRFDLKRLGK